MVMIGNWNTSIPVCGKNGNEKICGNKLEIMILSMSFNYTLTTKIQD